ncbi:MAG: hypothetical protein SFU56_17130 [Capsulimonadales bacterium]|nr:hypothetical protein [Capsulimonadales bacterium]
MHLREINFALGVVLAAFSSVGSAQAQADFPTGFPRKRFSAAIGGRFFLDREVRDFIAGRSVLRNLGYDLLTIPSSRPIVLQFYYENLPGQSKDRTRPIVLNLPETSPVTVREGETAKREALTGVGIAARVYLAGSGRTTVLPYAGVGIGYYHASVSASQGIVLTYPDGTPGFISDANTADGNGIGGKVFLGADHRSGLFGEAGYTFVPKAKLRVFRTERTFDFGGFDVCVGVRF